MANQSFSSRIKGAWNAFFNKDPTVEYKKDWDWWNPYYAPSSRPDRARLNPASEKTIVAAIYNRIAMDVAAVDIVHARLDEDGRYIETIKSSLNNCLTIEANIDQTGRAFIQDVAMSLLDEGSVAVVPIDTTANPYQTGSYDILSLRTGKITEWKPQHVRIDVYDEITGTRREILLPKKFVSIIESPLYSVMNDPNSVLQRLLRKLRLLDYVDEQTASNKLNMIIQLPYIIKTESRKIQAESRRKEIENQLVNSQYGIAYTDGTEKITQLSRPLENNLLSQVEYLTKMLYDQLGITDEILNGTANDLAMTNYYSRTIEPIVSSIVDEMKRKFLTKTARSQGQSIEFFRDPFRLVPIAQIADIADRFTRNEILSSNEVRQIIGRKPSNDPMADELRNKNLYPVDTDGDGIPDEEVPMDDNIEATNSETELFDDEELQNVLDSITDEIDKTDEDYLDELDEIDAELEDLKSEIKGELKHYASPYYDPVKAHEYYMKNRQLKGRKSTADLNERGKMASSYVKKSINEERDRKIEKSKLTKEANIKSVNNSRKQSLESLKNATKKILDSISNKSKKDLKSISESYKSQRSALSDKQKSAIKSQTENSKSKITRIRERLKNMSKLDKEGPAGEKLLAEIEKIQETTKKNKETIRESVKGAREKLSNKQKAETKSRRDKTKAERKSQTDSRKAASTSIRDSSKAKNQQHRDTHKKNVKAYREEAENKYIAELDKIKSESKYKRKKKR